MAPYQRSLAWQMVVGHCEVRFSVVHCLPLTLVVVPKEDHNPVAGPLSIQLVVALSSQKAVLACEGVVSMVWWVLVVDHPGHRLCLVVDPCCRSLAYLVEVSNLHQLRPVSVFGLCRGM